MKRDLNNLDGAIDAKQKRLAELKKELERMQQVNQQALKLDAISKKHDRELEGNRGAAPASLEARLLQDLKAATGTGAAVKDR